jgi:hypothetical protein
MANIKLFIVCFLALFMIGGFLNTFVSPFVDSTQPMNGSVLYGVTNFMENGMTVSLPFLSWINIPIYPLTWFWLGIPAITDYVVKELVLMSYLPDGLVLSIFSVIAIILGLTIVTIVRGD